MCTDFVDEGDTCLCGGYFFQANPAFLIGFLHVQNRFVYTKAGFVAEINHRMPGWSSQSGGVTMEEMAELKQC